MSNLIAMVLGSTFLLGGGTVDQKPIPAGGKNTPSVPSAGGAAQQPAVTVKSAGDVVVKIINLLHDSKAVHVSLNGKEVESDLAFGEVSKREATTDAKLKVAVTENGASAIDTTLDLAKDHKYVLVLHGGDKKKSVEAVESDFVTGKSRLVLFNMANGVTAADAYVDGKPVDKAQGLEHGKHGAITLDAGKHTIEVRSGKDVLISQQENLPADGCVFAFLAGAKAGAHPLSLVMVRETKPKA